MQARLRFGFGAQPSAEIVRVEGAKCRRDCVLSGATLCRDRAGRGREMQARLRFVRRNPLRRSCGSRARNAGDSAFWIGDALPSVDVEGAKCR